MMKPDSDRVRFVFIDTAPLIDKYRKDSVQYPDVQLVDPDAEVRWIDSVLRVSTEKWKIVVGHHPMYHLRQEGRHRAGEHAGASGGCFPSERG